MTVHIDRMDTSIEITSPGTAAPTANERRSSPTGDPRAAQDALRDLVGQLMSDELERFMRNRGM